MWKYDEPFYGKWLKVLICGYIRPEKNYDSLRKFKLCFLKLRFDKQYTETTKKLNLKIGIILFLPHFKDIISVDFKLEISVNFGFFSHNSDVALKFVV